MIEPTVGRIVWFYRRRDMAAMQENGRFPGGVTQPFPAIVCYVHNDREINIVAFDHESNMHPIRNVPLLQDNDELPRDGNNYCAWMPYQKGQAAALEKAVGEKGKAPVPGGDQRPDPLENPRPTV